MAYIATVTQEMVTVDGERMTLVEGEAAPEMSEAAAQWLLEAGWIVPEPEPEKKKGAKEKPETPESKQGAPETRSK